MFAIDIELGEPQYHTLWKLTLKRNIYDSNLPEMIKEKLASGHIHPDPSKIYMVDASFNITVYKEKAFYEFPAGCRIRQIRQPEQSPQERMEDRINEVLIWQLKKICQELSGAGIKYRYATIAGEDFKDTQQVKLRIYEDAATTAEVAAETDGRKTYDPKIYTILLHRSSIISKLTERVANSFQIYYPKLLK